MNFLCGLQALINYFHLLYIFIGTENLYCLFLIKYQMTNTYYDLFYIINNFYDMPENRLADWMKTNYSQTARPIAKCLVFSHRDKYFSHTDLMYNIYNIFFDTKNRRKIIWSIDQLFSESERKFTETIRFLWD